MKWGGQERIKAVDKKNTPLKKRVIINYKPSFSHICKNFSLYLERKDLMLKIPVLIIK